jgi:hypothetical protein
LVARGYDDEVAQVREILEWFCETQNGKDREMESKNSFTEGEQVRKLERVFQIFAHAQEEWAMTHSPGKSTGDMEKEDADVSV